MKFTHHPNKNKEQNRSDWEFKPSMKYENTEDHCDKPNGFWLSVDDDWRNWCSSEMPHWLRGTPEIEFTVDMSKILVIDTVEKFDSFYKGYASSQSIMESHSSMMGIMKLNWKPLTNHYSGIMIAPYLWERRHIGFYYSWDCASACIWDLTAVTMIGRVPQPPALNENENDDNDDDFSVLATLVDSS